MTDLTSIAALFALISLLFALEASTSLARIAGLNIGSLASGLQLQSGLSLFSRALMAIFMPMLGGLADLNYFNQDNLILVYFSTVLTPVFLCAIYMLKHKVLGVYNNSAYNLVENGSYFPVKIYYKKIIYRKIGKKLNNKIGAFRKVMFFSYFPYYLAWPIIIMLLSYYPNNRGFIIGLSSIMNGITTLALVLYVDPLLIKFSKYKNISIFIYVDQLKIRILSAILSTLPFIAAGVYLLIVK